MSGRSLILLQLEGIEKCPDGPGRPGEAQEEPGEARGGPGRPGEARGEPGEVRGGPGRLGEAWGGPGRPRDLPQLEGVEKCPDGP